MSEELRKFLRKLDEAHYDDSLNLPEKQSQGGSGPRERKPRDPRKSIVGVAVKGLWRNCYNPAWLATLKRHKIRDLQIIDEEYDFTIVEYSDEEEEEEEEYEGPEFVQGSSRG